MAIAILSAAAFIGSIGVCANMDFFNTPYVNAAAVAADMKYLGISHMRDLAPGSDPISLAPYARLARAGVKFDLIAGVGGYGLPATMTALQAQLDAFVKTYPGAIGSVEGPNEPNIYPFNYGGQGGTAAAVAYQGSMYNTVKADAALKGVPVVNFAYGGVDASTYAAAGNQSQMADAGNIHVYPDGNFNNTPQPSINMEQTLATVATPGKSQWLTEFGYSTYRGSDISPTLQARHEISGLLDAAYDGIGQVFLYELIDGATGTSDYESNFGQFRSDAITPKPAGIALHNLTTILATASGALPKPAMVPTVANLPKTARTLLMEKADGSLYLAIWNEKASRSATVSVYFGNVTSNAAIYDPLIGTTPVSNRSGVTGMTVALGSDPLIVSIQPAI